MTDPSDCSILSVRLPGLTSRLAGLYDRPLYFLLPVNPAQPPAAPIRRRTNIYIDGYNFYYGAVKNTAYKWLDFDRFVRLLRPHDDIQKIYYFTALTDGTARDRQDALLKALSTKPTIEIVLGKFLHKNVKCRVSGCQDAGPRLFKSPEEKRTDVNIAVYMLDDAYQDVCEQFVLLTGDSDLVPAIQRIKLRFPQKLVHVYVPSRGRPGHGIELRSSADRARDVPLQLLAKAQFPVRVAVAGGGFIDKPASW